MILEIVKYGDPVLRVKGARIGEPVEELRPLVDDMIDTMREANGVGLAAQQIGKPLQLAVIDVAGVDDRPSTMSISGEEVNLQEYMPLVLINPELEFGAEKDTGIEGCLSFPDITAQIPRSSQIHCKAQRLDGSFIEFDATGLLARALQHEVDHLNGVLFIDRMSSAAKVSLAGRLKRLQRER